MTRLACGSFGQTRDSGIGLVVSAKGVRLPEPTYALKDPRGPSTDTTRTTGTDQQV
jgi:hypothetical protein